jgi:hypothetical protein
MKLQYDTFFLIDKKEQKNIYILSWRDTCLKPVKKEDLCCKIEFLQKKRETQKKMNLCQICTVLQLLSKIRLINISNTVTFKESITNLTIWLINSNWATRITWNSCWKCYRLKKDWLWRFIIH